MKLSITFYLGQLMNNSNILSASNSGSFLLGGDLPIYRLGFGALCILGPGAWGPPADPKKVHQLLKRVIELDINFIDTADSYGPEVSENLIAEALYPYPKGLVIATKGGCTRSGPGVWGACGRPDYLIECVNGSLQRLRLERIDLYQLHCVDPEVPIEDSVGALLKMQQQGKIRHIGLSNVSVAELERAQKVVSVVSVQNHYNIAERESEDVLRYCEKKGLGFIPWYPLGDGSLANPGGKLDVLAKKKQATPAQVALAWLLKHSPVMLPIPGTSSLAHLEENVAAGVLQLDDQDQI